MYACSSVLVLPAGATLTPSYTSGGQDRTPPSRGAEDESGKEAPESCGHGGAMYVGGGRVAEEKRMLEPYRRPGCEANKDLKRCGSGSHADDELYSFRWWLRWMCVDQSGAWRAALSWAMFLGLGAAVPLVSHFVLVVDSDLEGRRRHASYDAVVQLSLTSVAAVSFFCLSAFVRRYGLRRFLFLDKLCGESETVRLGYTAQLNRSFRLLSVFVLPCFAAECGYKIWWYCTGAGKVPFLRNPYVSDAVACLLELCSWLYRTAIFFLVCVLFRLICYLQILRLQDFGLVFQEESDVAFILAEHLRIRHQLRIISHRFRSFIVTCLVLVTLSQLASLLVTTRSNAEVNLFNAGELAVSKGTRANLEIYRELVIPKSVSSFLCWPPPPHCHHHVHLHHLPPSTMLLWPLPTSHCRLPEEEEEGEMNEELRGGSEEKRVGAQLCSIGLVTGILICLRSATKITHKAQAITSHAAKWHVCCTVDSFDTETETPTLTSSCRIHPSDKVTESDCEEVDDDDDDTKLVQPNANTISFQKRQALGIVCQHVNLIRHFGVLDIFREQQSRDYLFWVHDRQVVAAHDVWRRTPPCPVDVGKDGWDLLEEQPSKWLLTFF
ncbi:hypothetical protein Taro_044231 [Colocasia esculenta]|uniref:Uncharacterized protein n=1 Tax=Colocasia esculenta TaxID=4460 RepID=A0A843WXT3_COLES|nr:hypothetical protein [Colocasia esculenta]